MNNKFCDVGIFAQNIPQTLSWEPKYLVSFILLGVRFFIAIAQNGTLHFRQLIRLSGSFKYALISFIAIIIVVPVVVMARKANANTKLRRSNFRGGRWAADQEKENHWGMGHSWALIALITLTHFAGQGSFSFSFQAELVSTTPTSNTIPPPPLPHRQIQWTRNLLIILAIITIIVVIMLFSNDSTDTGAKKKELEEVVGMPLSLKVEQE